MTLVKNSPANTGDLRDTVSISGLRRSPGEGHGNPLQYLCLENPVDKRAHWAIDHAFTGSDMTEATYHTAHTGNSVSTFSRGRQNNTQSFLK